MMDDELIEARFVDLCLVLNVLRKHQVTCKPAKAILFATEVEVAGHVVGQVIRGPIPGYLASLLHLERPQRIT